MRPSGILGGGGGSFFTTPLYASSTSSRVEAICAKASSAVRGAGNAPSRAKNSARRSARVFVGVVKSLLQFTSYGACCQALPHCYKIIVIEQCVNQVHSRTQHPIR